MADGNAKPSGDWVELMSRRTESPHRRAVAVLEAVTVTGWLSESGQTNLGALGFSDRMAMYCGTRGGPMGAVAPSVVAAIFYNFRSDVIERSTKLAWETASPEQILAAELAAVDSELGPIAAQLPAADVKELAALLHEAGQIAAAHTDGRPLAAGVASMAWPDEPHLSIWHTHHLLREHRGDAHNACLQSAGLSGLDALVIDCARSGFPAAGMRAGRFWPEDLWEEAAADLRERGWIDADDELTEKGRQGRRDIEDQTDQLSAVSFRSLGESGTARIIELGTVFGNLASPLALTKPRTRLSVDGA
jgi:hypothetical protein